MEHPLEITEVGRLVRLIHDIRVTAASLEMRLCRGTAVVPDHRWRAVRRMREVADKLERGEP